MAAIPVVTGVLGSVTKVFGVGKVVIAMQIVVCELGTYSKGLVRELESENSKSSVVWIISSCTSIFKLSSSCTKTSDYNWYYHHFHVPLLISSLSSLGWTCPVGCGCKRHPLFLWRGIRHPQIVSWILFTNISAWAGYETRSIFKRSLTGLNSEFSFS